jgi:hypothetical protein
MDEALKQLVETCSHWESGKQLSPERLEEFCSTHQISLERFSFLFAKHVALEFADGLMSYRRADAAMNRLGIEGAIHSAFAERIYEAFDAGEYQHEGDAPGTISWQKYTLPLVMAVLSDEGLLPST